MLALLLMLLSAAAITGAPAAEAAPGDGRLDVRVLSDVPGGPVSSPQVELYDPNTLDFVGRYSSPGTNGWVRGITVPQGSYLLVTYNGTADVYEDYFPELYDDRPFLDLGRATLVTIRSGRTTTLTTSLPPLFVDMFDTVFTETIFFLRNAGITRGCNPEGGYTLYCPGQDVTRGQMATFLAEALGLPPAPSAGFRDTRGTTHEESIDRLFAAGITKGCGTPADRTFCPSDPVTRGQMARFVAEGFGLPDAAPDPGFVDDDGTTFEADIARIADARITRGCSEPNSFCPREPVNRGQMSAFISNAFDWVARTAAAPVELAPLAPAGGDPSTLDLYDVHASRSLR